MPWLGIIVGLALILGRALANRIEPLEVGWPGAGLVGLCAVAFGLVLWWFRGFQFDVLQRGSHNRWISTVMARLRAPC